MREGLQVRRESVSFQIKLSALAPLLVGSGRVLGRFDYSLTVNPRSGAPLIRVLDVERFIEESPLPPEKKTEAIEKRSAAVLDRFSRYVLGCQFREAREDLLLVEFHRDGSGRPLVPASALRGMLRTAVLFSVLSARPGAIGEAVDAAMEGRWRRERAADKLERRLLGRSEEDPFRALRIGEPAPASNEDLRAYEVSVMTLAGGPLRPKLSLFLEALSPRAGAVFDFPVSIDRGVFSRAAAGRPAPGAAPELRGGPAQPSGAEEGPPAAPPEGRQATGRPGSAGVSPPQALLEGREPLLGALRRFSEAVVEGERRFYSEAGARDLGRLLEETLRRAEGRIALPFGFGAGWRSKTVGLLLGTRELMRLAPLLSPGRPYYRRGPAPVFPKSRRWVLEAGRPSAPLGWALVE